MPPVWDADPPGGVHEPLQLQLPALPATAEVVAHPPGPAPPPRMTARMHALVEGRVQGVGYRYFVRELARAAGLSGVARNLADGRVEVVLEGPEDGVESVLAELDGPRAPGRVARVEAVREPPEGVMSFTTE